MADARLPGLPGRHDQLLAVDDPRDPQRLPSHAWTERSEVRLRRLPDPAGPCRSPPRLCVMARSLPPPRLGSPACAVHDGPRIRHLGRERAPLRILPPRLWPTRSLRPRLCRNPPQALQHQPARSREQLLPPPSRACVARHLPRASREGGKPPVSFLLRCVAPGEVARACARRRGQPQLARTSPAFSANFESKTHPTSHATHARDRLRTPAAQA